MGTTDNILNYLYEKSSFPCNLSSDVIMFHPLGPNKVGILVSFKKNLTGNEDDDSEGSSLIDLSDFKKFKNRSINGLKISAFEYLGGREDFDKSFHRTPSSSICYCLHSLLREMVKYPGVNGQPGSTAPGAKSLFKIVDKHILSLNYGYDAIGDYCTSFPNYILDIRIQYNYFDDSDFIKYTLKAFSKLPKLRPPGFYWTYLKVNPAIPDKMKMKTFSTNTKARRIGYLKLLVKFVSEQSRISRLLINKNFEKYVSPFKGYLEKYKNSRGIITPSKTGISAKPYIELGESVGLLNFLNGYYAPGKDCKVYVQLQKEFGSDECFKLSLLDKIFFGELLLKNDFFYLTNILELIFILETSNYLELRENFQVYLLKKLEEIRKRAVKWGGVPRQATNEIKTIHKRIKEWKKPDIYIEHLLMPRLNWLLDLELIDMDNQLNLSLTPEGERLFKNFCCWCDINCGRIVTPDAFLERFSIHMFYSVYQPFKSPGEIKEKPKEMVEKRIIECIDGSFEYFRTLAPNRVTASQAINYTKFKLFLKDSLIVEYNDIRDFLEKSGQKHFAIMMQKRYNDGYIQKNKCEEITG